MRNGHILRNITIKDEIWDCIAPDGTPTRLSKSTGRAVRQDPDVKRMGGTVCSTYFNIPTVDVH